MKTLNALIFWLGLPIRIPIALVATLCGGLLMAVVRTDVVEAFNSLQAIWKWAVRREN